MTHRFHKRLHSHKEKTQTAVVAMPGLYVALHTHKVQKYTQNRKQGSEHVYKSYTLDVKRKQK